MSDTGFPKPVGEVIGTIADIFRHQGKNEILEILESAHARIDEIDYDNWNGGTYIWALRLEVPVSLFAMLDPRLTSIEKEIEAKVRYIERLYPNDPIREVTITPIAPGSTALGSRMAPSELEVRRLWPDGRIRVFLSHVAEHKVAVTKLKDELAWHGVTAFVAHQDVKPGLTAQPRIRWNKWARRGRHALPFPPPRRFH